MDINNPLVKNVRDTLNGFPDFLGIELDDIDDTTVTVHVDMRPEFLNVQLIPHGGIIATLMDEAAGIASYYFSGGKKLVTRSMDIHYLRASKGSRLYACSKVVQIGRKTSLITVDCKDSDGRLIAAGSFELYFV